jgi:hypothetical protein
LKQEIGLLQSANQALTNRAEKLTIDYTRMQEMSSHQRKQIDDQRDQIASLQTGFKHGGLCTPVSRRTVAAVIETGIAGFLSLVYCGVCCFDVLSSFIFSMAVAVNCSLY